MKLRRNYLFPLTAICVAIFFINLDAVYVNIMEARNFITAREMLNEGNWIFTTMNAEPRYEKPPLPTWMTALSMSVFGMENLFALRLSAALSTLLLVLFFYRLVVSLTKQKKFAWIASLILMTSFYIIFSGRNGQWDIFAHAFMMAGIYFFYLFFTSEEQQYRNVIFAAIFFGFSFLSKGPVSHYALLLPFLVAFGWVYKFKSLRTRWKPLLLLLLLTIIISGWWNLYVYLFDTRAVAKITERETGRWLDYNVRPFYYYWNFFVHSGIWAIPALISLLYPYLKNKVFDKKAYKFALFWTLASVLLLSVIPEKKVRYLLPVFIPLALNTAFYIEYLFRNFGLKMPKKEVWIVYFNFGLIALIGLAFPVAGYIYFGSAIADFPVWFGLTAIFLTGIGLIILINLRRKNIEKVFYLTVAFMVSIIWFGLPMAKYIQVNENYNSITNVKPFLEEENLLLYEFRGFSPEIIWEYGQSIPLLEEGEALPPANAFYLLAEEGMKETLEEEFPGYELKKVESFDMNPVSSTHKSRLYRDLYLLRKY
ncbi:ArnT family glycosyltransferase [Autumnicola musiva]|uniref:Glycosyltransferase family 39 protein n=1 Tax=Autumnicola musiva TaxID=3075589 RepID=A0ABU3D7B7_9FLAO|nr:glycosyltransferase family 39 protein [Zunongwangia sp. F117]MDT0677255.1 glycosyltransferase family 39 protein [Zunongwangia sp. F117]